MRAGRDASTEDVEDVMPFAVVACLGIVRQLDSAEQGSSDIAWLVLVSCRRHTVVEFLVVVAYRQLVGSGREHCPRASRSGTRHPRRSRCRL